MIIEAKSIPHQERIEADLCVIGAGPAGLSVAARFLGSEHRVFVLESGSFHVDEPARRAADAEIVGLPYFDPAAARARVLGGSSYLWDEWMRARPLDPIDFERRAWVDRSGWPFGRAEFEPYYQEAHQLLGLGPYQYETGVETIGEGGWSPQQAEHLGCVLFRYSNRADFTLLRPRLEQSANVCVLLGATALELLPDASGRRVEAVHASAANPHRFSIQAREVVLAAGGLENPRLLLLSRSLAPSGLGNEHDLVGRFFMEHPLVRRGAVVPRGEGPLFPDAFLRLRRHDGSAVRAAFTASVETMRRREILNGMVLVTPTSRLEASETYRSLAIVRERLRGAVYRERWALHLGALLSRPRPLVRTALDLWRGRGMETVYRLSVTLEQAPNPSSRVRLGTRLDDFGLPIAALDWRLGDQEEHTARQLQELLDAELRARGLGQVDGFLGEERPRRSFLGEYHQMGTTRMSSHPREGVVDEECRVHGIENLYVAGGSVFPTVGYANPTLTIVALGLRLADMLARRLRRRPSLGAFW